LATSTQDSDWDLVEELELVLAEQALVLDWEKELAKVWDLP